MTTARVPYARLMGRLLRLGLHPAGLRPWGVKRTLVLLLFLPAFIALQLVHWVGLIADEVLFPGYRDLQVREPLFVVGLPRSGTSYIQRVLAADASRFTTLRLWEVLLAPSISERRILLAVASVDRRVGRPLGRLVDLVESIVFRFMDAVHPVDLSEPEEDYLLLLPAFACFLLVVPFPAHPAVWALSRFDDLPEPTRESLMAFYHSCLQRHLYVVGSQRQILSKNPSFTSATGSLANFFPDARFLFCVRDPRDSVPSQLSSLRDGATAFGWDVRSPAFRDKFVGMMEEYSECVVGAIDHLPRERSAVLPLSAVRENLESSMTTLYRRFGWSPDPTFRAWLAGETPRAREHRSEHRYSQEEFGLTSEGLAKRFSLLLRRLDSAGGVVP